jgi:hypothetical protein
MFEKIGRAAEQVAANVSVSRRGFLGWLGRVALAAAGGGADLAGGQRRLLRRPVARPIAA